MLHLGKVESFNSGMKYVRSSGGQLPMFTSVYVKKYKGKHFHVFIFFKGFKPSVKNSSYLGILQQFLLGESHQGEDLF